MIWIPNLTYSYHKIDRNMPALSIHVNISIEQNSSLSNSNTIWFLEFLGHAIVLCKSYITFSSYCFGYEYKEQITQNIYTKTGRCVHFLGELFLRLGTNSNSNISKQCELSEWICMLFAMWNVWNFIILNFVSGQWARHMMCN